MRRIATTMMVLGALGFLALGLALIARQSFAGRAQLVQRIQEDKAGAELFGDSAGTPIGSPQMLIIQDPGAFLPGEGENGAKLVSQDYLDKNKIYPLQLQTVDFFANTTMLTGGIGGVLLLVAGNLLRRKAAALP